MAEKIVGKQLPNVVPQILAEMTIDKDDLLSIVVAKHEESLEIERRSLDTQIKNLNKEQTEITQKLTKLAKTHAELELRDKINLAIQAFKSLGFEEIKFTITMNQSPPSEEEEEDPLIFQFNRYAIDFSDTRRNYGNNSLMRGFGKLILNNEEKIHLARLQEIEMELQTKQIRAVEVRSELANLGQKERQARARIATRVLERTEEGQALLDSIKDIKALSLD